MCNPENKGNFEKAIGTREQKRLVLFEIEMLRSAVVDLARWVEKLSKIGFSEKLTNTSSE